VPGCPDRAAFIDRFVRDYTRDPFGPPLATATAQPDVQVRFEASGRREYSVRLTTGGRLPAGSTQLIPTRRCAALLAASVGYVFSSLPQTGPSNTLYQREAASPAAPAPSAIVERVAAAPVPQRAPETQSVAAAPQQAVAPEVSRPSPEGRALGLRLGLGGHWEAASTWSTMFTLGGYHAWSGWSLGAQALVTVPLDTTTFEAPVAGTLRFQRVGLAAELCRTGRWTKVRWGICALAGATLWWGTFRQNNGVSSSSRMVAAELGGTARLEWPARGSTRFWLGGAASVGVPSLGWLAQPPDSTEPQVIAEMGAVYLGMMLGVAISR